MFSMRNMNQDFGHIVWLIWVSRQRAYQSVNAELRKLYWRKHWLEALGQGSKDRYVMEYAMNRQLSPAMVAQYELQLPDKQLPQAKLHEFFVLNDLLPHPTHET
ncbi:MAG: hypothetical protein OHK0039_41500 [Bacteroidia bacterium]